MIHVPALRPCARRGALEITEFESGVAGKEPSVLSMTKVFELDLAARERRELAPADLNIDPSSRLLYWVHVGSGDAATLEQVIPKLGLPATLAAEWAGGDAFAGLTEDADSIALAIEYWDPNADHDTGAEKFYVWHCQVDENHVDRPPRYWALARRGPTMLGIKNSRQPQLDNDPWGIAR